jgi:hypothetical protein
MQRNTPRTQLPNIIGKQKSLIPELIFSVGSDSVRHKILVLLVSSNYRNKDGGMNRNSKIVCVRKTESRTQSETHTERERCRRGAHHK